MQFLNSIRPAAWLSVALIIGGLQQGYSQINSPYSRYGLGDLYNSRNVVNKAMGGLSTPYYDYQSVNFSNPASYSRLQTTTYDLGLEYESRAIKEDSKSLRDKSANLVFNYMALGMPLQKDKKGVTKWGLALGLRPLSRINYKVSDSKRTAIDSMNSTYQGNGGANKAFLGTGYRIGGFSAGANFGFVFGNTTNSTYTSFINDSVLYYTGIQQRNISYNSLFADWGVQYELNTGKHSELRFGATGFLGQKMKAHKDQYSGTAVRSSTGAVDSLDVVDRQYGVRGQIELPSGYSFGLLYERYDRFMIGAEYEVANWSKYRSFGQAESLGNTSMLRVGGQWQPKVSVTSRNYFRRVAYRAGFYTGKDNVIAAGKQLPVQGISFGASLPVRKYSNYSNQFTVVNTSFEFGNRGNKDQPLRENFFKLNIGLNLSDIWFVKRRYD